jgi:lipopolysaccharide export system permease protein
MEPEPMKTVRRLLYAETIRAIGFVSLGFIALFFFFDFVEELKAVNQIRALGYQIPQALLFVGLMVPTHVYELLPITVLIGSVFVMARFAKSSEFTILRTSGLGPWLALKTLLILGLGFVLLTFVVGDYVSPLADRSAQFLKSAFKGKLAHGKTGTWLKEKQVGRHFAVNVGSVAPDGSLREVRIFEFDDNSRFVSVTNSQWASAQDNAQWTLHAVKKMTFVPDGLSGAQTVTHSQTATLSWPNSISADMVAAAILRPENMGTVDLFNYVQHLSANGQSVQKYEIQFWKKVFYPLSCLVMVVLALPFAYLHFRSGGISVYVFGGVMAGISFLLLNNVLSDMATLQGWQPWLAAALPGLIYSVVSLSAFTWLVLRR